MTVNGIVINTKCLNKDRFDMNLKLIIIKNNMNDMFESIRELDTMWEGTAKSEFTNQFNIDYATLKDICKSIKEFMDCMKYASEEYTRCENTVNDLIDAIKL